MWYNERNVTLSYMNFFKRNLKLILILFLGVMLILITVFWLNKNKKQQVDNFAAINQSSFIIPLEYLSPSELQALGVDPALKAQVINRDPLVYKIIQSDNDIIKDRREVELQRRD